MVRSIPNSIFGGCVLAILLLLSRCYAQTRFYVSNHGDGTIDAVSSTGAITPFVTGLTSPLGLAMDNSGNLYVAEYDANYDILKITPNGIPLVFASMPGPTEGLAFDKSGNLYAAVISSVSSSAGIMKIAADGTQSIFASQSAFQPQGIAFDSNGNLFVANYYGSTPNTAVDEITPSGDIESYSPTPSIPFGIAVDADNNVFVTGTFPGSGGRRGGGLDYGVCKVTTAGITNTYDQVSASQELTGIAFDDQGNLYVCNAFSNTISEINPDGTVIPFASGLNVPAYILYVPEPTSAIVGLFAVLVASQRSRRAATILRG